ncbi:hypothetical protein OIY81_541 [Cryptosporidium canis]|uniref:Uncharacterized protein n=1 Tax=Cryptosporidium canis TaxID=195482 RepID=A0ABQ8P709_9CRYT|nr:hypothetical protein OJ252_1782 [Cryptosporidium canis]KAJ1614385.1 hypothetical protein OIY81_541 [Cryptosporidium canis]
MEIPSKKHNSLFSHIRSKCNVFSIRSAGNLRKGRLFLSRKNGLSNTVNEKMKGVNVPFNDTRDSDTLINSNPELISSTSPSILSGSLADFQSKNACKDHSLASGPKPGNERTKRFTDNITDDHSKNTSKRGEYLYSRSTINSSLQVSSVASLLSESSSSSESKSSEETNWRPNNSHISSKVVPKLTNSIYTRSDECTGTLNRGSESSEQDNFAPTSKNQVSDSDLEKTRLEQHIKIDKETMTDSRTGEFCLNKSVLDALNNKDQLKGRKRTTQKVVAIEKLEVNGKDTPRSFVPTGPDKICNKKRITVHIPNNNGTSLLPYKQLLGP